MLAGISVEYYTRFERGNAREPPRTCLRASRVPCSSTMPNVPICSTWSGPQRHVAIEPPETGPGAGAPDRPADPHSITAPAYVRNGRLDLLAGNTLGLALYAPVFEDPSGTTNMARFIFLHPGASEFFPDWERIANDAVAILRAAAGRDPYDKPLSDLIGELSTRSEEFRVRWAAHNVKFHRTGAKLLHHPVVGDLTLDYEALELAGDTGQRILVYSAEPGSPSQDALDLLASWATTPTSPRADEVSRER